MNTADIRQEVNQTIIRALKDGLVPWRSDYGFPKNVLNRRRYEGVSAVLLMLAGQRKGFKSPYWASSDDWQLLGGKVTPNGGTSVVVLKTGLFGVGRGLVGRQVYNLDEVEGDFPASRSEQHGPDWEGIHRVIFNTGADLRFTHEPKAEYHFPGTDKNGDGDYIICCLKEHFDRGPGGSNAFYHVLLHELVHWTEPGARLGWYSRFPDVQELRAEIGSDFLTTELAIPGFPYQARRNLHKHIGIWAERMAENPKLIFEVALAATEAKDYILAITERVEAGERLREGWAA
jgi:antirestriction protein ArdC